MKANKKGISLIVLVITIIVVIILAAAVILTLNKNNPIDSARVAQLVDSRSSLNSALTLYWTNEIRKSQGQLTAEQIIKGDSTVTIDGYTMPAAIVDTSATAVDGAYPVKDDAATALDVTLPSITNATWYINPVSAQFYLVYNADASYPNWMGVNEAGEITDTTLASFVKKAGA